MRRESEAFSARTREQVHRRVPVGSTEYIAYITRLSTRRGPFRPFLGKPNSGSRTVKQRRTVREIRSAVNKITRITFAPVRAVITEIYAKTFLHARA